MNESLKMALDYLERGFGLIPTVHGGKQPNHQVLQEIYGSPAWKPFTHRRASEPDVRAWFEQDPSTGLGVLTGAVSEGLAVMDVDRPAEAPNHPPTPMVETARGHHLYLRSEGRVASQTFSWGELKGEGGYVIAPPSHHPDGTVYRWILGPGAVSFAPSSEVDLFSGEPSPAPEMKDSGLSTVGGLGELGTPYELPRTPSEGSSTPIRALACHDEPVRAACAVLGIPDRLGRSFRCPLPGHEESHPSASLFKDPMTGVWRFHDWHGRSGIEWLSLAEVRASLVCGRVVPLRPPAAARWYARLFHEAGVITAVPVDLPPLPHRPRPAVIKVAEGFALLVGLRFLMGDVSPVPYTQRFAGGWNGIGPRAAGEAIKELRRFRIIEQVDEHRRGPRTTPLYVPGRGLTPPHASATPQTTTA